MGLPPVWYTLHMSPIKQIAHLCLGTTNLTQSEHFYCTALGLKKKFRFIRDGKEFGFYLELGQQTFIEVFEQLTIAVSAHQPIQHLCLQVEDLETVISQLRCHGYAVTDPQMGADRSWQCWVTDPQGVRIEFHQYTAESSQVTGHDCVFDSPGRAKT